MLIHNTAKKPTSYLSENVFVTCFFWVGYWFLFCAPVTGQSDAPWWACAAMPAMSTPTPYLCLPTGLSGKPIVTCVWCDVSYRLPVLYSHSSLLNLDFTFPNNTCKKYCCVSLKGQCHEIFCFWFFSWISFPQAPEYTIRVVSNFFENSRRYSQLKVDHRYQRHRWQICHRYQRHRRQVCHRCRWYRWQTMRLISGWGGLKVNLKAKIYIYVNSTIQRCPNKIITIFLIKDFFHLPPVSATPVVKLELRISPRILEKIRNGPNGILWGWGVTDS